MSCYESILKGLSTSLSPKYNCEKYHPKALPWITKIHYLHLVMKCHTKTLSEVTKNALLVIRYTQVVKASSFDGKAALMVSTRNICRWKHNFPKPKRLIVLGGKLKFITHQLLACEAEME